MSDGGCSVRPVHVDTLTATVAIDERPNYFEDNREKTDVGLKCSDGVQLGNCDAGSL